MIQQVDHLVIAVHDLDQTIADYAALGFSVVRGGEHPGGATHNALVVFADGAYIELIAFMRATPEHQWWARVQRSGEGLIDYALLPGETARDVAEARERGLDIVGPYAGGRTRPDAVRLEWQTARAASFDLPFLCGDVTPRNLRVPEGELRQHANGARGVAEIVVAVNDLAASVSRYRALLGDLRFEAPPAHDNSDPTVQTASFRLRDTLITLVAPHNTSGGERAGELRDLLATRGEGPYVVHLRAEPGAVTDELDRGLTHGARLRLVADERHALEESPLPS